MSYNSFVYDLSAKVEKSERLVCDKTPTPVVVSDDQYYKGRFENFMDRHTECPHKPPLYYYGDLSDTKVVGFPDTYPNATDTSVIACFLPVLASSHFFLRTTIGLDRELSVRQNAVEAYGQDGKTYYPVLARSYGYKYSLAFGKLLKPYLSDDGKKWADDTLELLQQYMEKGVVEQAWVSPRFNTEFNKLYGLNKVNLRNAFYKDIELNPSRFKTFAFATHPDAYLFGGLTKRLVERHHYADLMMIICTPDLSEWRDRETWLQAWVTIKGVWDELDLGTWAKNLNPFK